MEILLSATSTRSFRVNAAFETLLQHNGITSARSIYEMESESVKKVLKERGTSRVFLIDPAGGPDVECYIKRYLKPSLKDRVKCTFSFKPVFNSGALHEWDALCAFHRAGLQTMIPVAAGSFENKTCNLTLGITDYVRASELFAGELRSDPERRRRLIVKIAEYAARMHAAGLAHQDFYLVHLFIKPQEYDAIYLIDLQRVLIQNRLARRWIIKDLAQIRFAMASFISNEEAELFRETYETIRPLPRTVWQSVEKKACRIRKHVTKCRA
jgi:heptose I phosphotransferase